MCVPTCILLATTSTVPSVVCVTHRPKLSSQVTCGVSRHAASLPSLPRACLARHSGTTAFQTPSSTREKSGGRRGQSQKKRPAGNRQRPLRQSLVWARAIYEPTKANLRKCACKRLVHPDPLKIDARDHCKLGDFGRESTTENGCSKEFDSGK